MISLPLRFSQGHLFTVFDGQPWLIDTGGPQSFGNPTHLGIGGRTFQISPSYTGLTPEQLSGFVKEPCVGLLGMDILSQFHLTLDVPGQTMILTPAPPAPHGTRLTLRFFMGIPIVEAEIGGTRQSLFFDTGAQHSYWQNNGLIRFPPEGTVSDFYPGFGQFETALHWVPLHLAGKTRECLFGRLPELLGMTLQMAGVHGILGNEVCRDQKVTFRFPESCLSLGEAACIHG
jgi:hypothetical protein